MLEEKWYTPKFDPVFKSIYTKKGNEHLLLSLINTVLRESNEFACFRPVDLSIRTIKERKKILDVLLETKDGKTILVEVNTNSSYTTLFRNINYLHSYSSQATKASEEYDPYSKFVLINFNYESKDSAEMIEIYHYREDKSGKLLTDAFTIINVNVDKIIAECYNNGVASDYAEIVMLNLSKRELEKMAETNKDAKIILRSLITMNSDEKFVRLMTEEEEKIFMAKGLKAEGIKEGIQEGIEQGIEQGLKDGIEQGKSQERANIIKTMISNNISIEDIAKMLNMPVNDVNKITNEN